MEVGATNSKKHSHQICSTRHHIIISDVLSDLSSVFKQP